MKIIFIGNGNLKFAGLRHFGYDTRIFNGLVRNGHCVYFFSDRDEVRQSSPFGAFKSIGRKRTNEKLLRVVDNLRPDVIVLAHVDMIYPATFQDIRRLLPGIRVGQVNVDPLFNPKNRANLARRRDIMDATFVTTGGSALNEIASSRNPCYFIPNFSDSSIDTGTAFARHQLQYDVACFMLGDSGKPSDEEDRVSLASGVAGAISGLRTCYGGFNNLPIRRGCAYIDSLSDSAMGLNLSKHVSDGVSSTPKTRYLYSSDRIAHFMGNGCLTFTQDGFGLENLYEPDEVAFFRDLPELVDKVRYYKQNPDARQAIAKKGWLKAHSQFNSTVIMKYVLERLCDTPLSQPYAWPMEAYRPVEPAAVSVTPSRASG